MDFNILSIESRTNVFFLFGFESLQKQNKNYDRIIICEVLNFSRAVL